MTQISFLFFLTKLLQSIMLNRWNPEHFSQIR